MFDLSARRTLDRLAVQGEEVVVHKFRNRNARLVPGPEFDDWRARRRGGFWQWLMDLFSSGDEALTVVHIPPGTWVRLVGIPEVLRGRAGKCQEAIFMQLLGPGGECRDALSLAYGNALLQFVPHGQRLKILWLSSAQDTTPEMDEFEPAPYSGVMG
ncbi:MAG TPA: hypothetical protein VG273_22705 [Bryobacteraceae bacterium]|jgi:hypothetical protein|nr:hypothetical protein [Bryobacteraceae bacterium]